MDKIPTGYIVLNSQDEVIVNQVLQTLNNKQVPINTDTLTIGFRTDYPVVLWNGFEIRQYRRTSPLLRKVPRLDPEDFIKQFCYENTNHVTENTQEMWGM